MGAFYVTLTKTSLGNPENRTLDINRLMPPDDAKPNQLHSTNVQLISNILNYLTKPGLEGFLKMTLNSNGNAWRAIAASVALLSIAAEVGAEDAPKGRDSARISRAKAERARALAKSPHPGQPSLKSLDVPQPDRVDTLIRPHHEADKDSKMLQSRVAEFLSRHDAPYADRALHFAWLQNDPYFQQIQGRVSGWRGVIKEVEQLPEGGWIATIRVGPRIYPQSRAILLDYVEETYRFQHGNLVMVATDVFEKKPDKKQIYTPF
ncbi:hypothetical protein V5E97_29200 [Singulisphaera sp. Ch08]|uniref:Uncharacterized protein n=1 Tax=Singulisphaera sp. Ch08 TaxID=3120278 RepID=A0AAU7CB47_9BACT